MNEPFERVRAAFEGIFEIERELGQGSIAFVYAAREIATDRRVALKVLFPELTPTVGAERFEREIRIGSRLSHPHIVPIHGSGRANGFLYFTMPLLEGESLAQRIDREGQLPVWEALAITRQVAGALEHAHEHGVIHRDIKPQNIMLTAGGAIMMDFGIAALVRAIEPERLTEAGLAMGTPDYMSPEQATGDRDLDGRTDVYSLACVLYEMLAGHPPFHGSSAQTVLARHARDPVPPLSSVRPGVSVPIESVVLKALAKLPADRFSSPAELSAALDMAEQGVTPRGVTPVGTVLRDAGGRPSGPRHRSAVMRVAVGVAAVAAVLFATYRLASETGPEGRGPDLATILPRPDPDASRPVDRCTWGIAPFRTTGASAEIASLGVGLGRVLDGAVNDMGSGSAILASTSDEVQAARREALDRRYPYLVTGAIVGGPERITVQARRMATRTGRVLGDRSITGPADSLNALVGRLALQLAIPTMDAATAAHIAETPPSAVTAALEGMSTLCAEPGEGKWPLAVQRFEQALEIDSTFGVAALLLNDLEVTFGAERVQFDFASWEEIVWRLRDRIPAADRFRLELRREPGSGFARNRLERLRDAVERFPESSQLQGDLGYTLVYSGEYLGIEDWAAEAGPPLRAQAEMLNWPGGVDCLGEAWILARLPNVPPERWDDYRHCPFAQDSLTFAMWRRDSAEVRRLQPRGHRQPVDGWGYFYFAPQLGFPIEGWRRWLDANHGTGTTFPDRLHTSINLMAYQRITGHPRRAARLADSIVQAGTGVDFTALHVERSPWFVLLRAIESAIYEPGPAPYLAGLENRLSSLPDSARFDPYWGWNNRFDRLCGTELARVAHGDTSRTERAIRTMVEDRTELDVGWFCPERLAAMREHLRGDGDRALATLDSVMTLGPTGHPGDAQGALTLARIYWARGDTTNAWKWIRRRRMWREMSWNMAPWLRADGRISVAVGELDRARRVYRRFLILREDPEPGALRAQRDSVRTELACIDDEFVDLRDPEFCRSLLGASGES